MATTQNNQDGYFTKAEYESNEGIISISDSGAFYSLSPAERVEIAQKVKDQVENGQDFENLKDETTSYMLMKAYTQLEIINKATSKAYTEFKNQLDKDISQMANGEIKNIELNYKDRNGNEVRDTVGVGKDRNGNVYYYEEKYRADGMPVVKNIGEDDFDSRISDSLRNHIKEREGIGQNLYEMTDNNGNKLIITDARDDSSRQNSFNDGLRGVNVYAITNDGNKEQLTKKNLTDTIKHGGITNQEINTRMTRADIAKAVAGSLAGKAKSGIKQALDIGEKPGDLLQKMQQESELML